MRNTSRWAKTQTEVRSQERVVKSRRVGHLKQRYHGETGTFVHCQWECKMGCPLWKMAWHFLKQLNIEARGIYIPWNGILFNLKKEGNPTHATT